jgi:hypothetical protein
MLFSFLHSKLYSQNKDNFSLALGIFVLGIEMLTKTGTSNKIWYSASMKLRQRLRFALLFTPIKKKTFSNTTHKDLTKFLSLPGESFFPPLPDQSPSLQ